VSALGASDAVSSFARVLCVLVGMSLVTSCLGTTYRWKEEVQLHDGRVIVIERSVRTGDAPTGPVQQPAESDYTLKFKADGKRLITWVAGKNFVPMILDIKDGVPYVVAVGRTGTAYELEGCPKPPYFLFRHRGDAWERVPYEKFPGDIRKRNLLSGATYREEPVAAVKRGLVTREDIQRSLVGLDTFNKEIRADRPMPLSCIAQGKR
jgi:hypothetical protein